MTSERDELAVLIREGFSETKAQLDTLRDENDSLRRDLKQEVGYREEMERKVNLLQLRPAGDTGNSETLEHAEFLQRAVKSLFPTRATAHIDLRSYHEYREAFSHYIRHGREMLGPEEAKAMQVGVDVDGGYIVDSQFNSSILAVEGIVSVVRGLANTIPTRTGEFEIPVALALPTTAWVGETSGRPKTDHGKLGKITIIDHEIYTEPAATQRLLDDAIWNVERFLAERIGRAFGEAEEESFTSGDGVSCPRGFLTYPTAAVSDSAGTRPFGTVEHIASGQAGAWPASDDLIYDFLQKIVYALSRSYRRNARWLMPTSCILKLSQMKDAQKRPLYLPSMAAGQPGTLLGYPIEESPVMPDVGANSYSIAFADWKAAYWITDRTGIRLLRDPYTDKPNVLFYTTRRTGGGIVDSTAIKLGKFSDS